MLPACARERLRVGCGRPVSSLFGEEDGGRTRVPSSLPSSRLLQPVLIFGALLPALVGLAGADQLDVGAEVAAFRAGAVARALGVQAEVRGIHLVGGSARPGQQVAALKTN